ncbi:MAG: response regulator [Aquabacterium sp.]
MPILWILILLALAVPVAMLLRRRLRQNAQAATLAQAQLDRALQQMSRLTLVATRVKNGVVIMDRLGVIEWVNPAWLALTGWAEMQVIGQALPDLLSHDVRDSESLPQLRQHLQAGTPFRLSYEASRHGTDTPYWGEIDAFEVLDDAGQVSQYVCLFTDITRRKAQDVQREQERAFQEALLANLPVSLFVVDPVRDQIVTINRHAEVEFNLQRDKVVGRSIQQAMGQEVLQRVQAPMQAATVSGQPVEHDFSWQDGPRTRVINARHFALRHADGRPRLLISLVRDITVAQRALSDLEESERRFRELVESMDDGVYVSDGERAQCLYLSPQTGSLLGLSPNDATNISDRLRALVIAEDRTTLAHQEEQERRSESTDALLRLDIPGRGVRWMRHKSRSRHLLSGESRIYGLLSDVTDERQQALDLQRARDQAETASHAKSEFMANMSHEIRTPMNGILGMTELLLGTELSDKQRRFAQAVYRSGESLLEIINDILDFAKIEAGHVELSKGDFVLRTLVEDTLELLAPRAHERGLELSFREEPGLPPVVHGDPLRLRQILTNLVANAIKFTEHGEVVIDIRRASTDSARLAPTDQTPDTMTLAFQVRDTGIGITAENLPRIFQAFVQAQGGMTRRYGGTGLGLPISKQLVELMGGSLNVCSTPGVGSAFSFDLPVGISHTQMAHDLVSEPHLPAYKVLVVDDNETNRTVLENMLSAWGMKVILAQSGRQALDLLLTETQVDLDIDLALVDMHMPELDGLSMVEILRRSRRYPQLKMVLLSSLSSADEVRRAQDAGFHSVLRKPLRKTELRQTLQSLSAQLGGSEEHAQAGLHKRVLVVEDNPVNQEVCGQMLRRLGCEVRVASSALEGLRRLGEQRYDLILMDIQMPGMDGIEALTWFRNGTGKRFTFLTPPETPVIAVTANALEGDEQRFLDMGFDDYLSKPFRQGQLQQMLVAHTTPTGITGAAVTPPSRVTRPQPASPPASTATAQLLDPDALRRLRELDPKGENHLLERVARAFETSLSRLLPQLSEAGQQQDLATVAHVAHTLKSSSASIGALKLSQMCADLESIIRRQTGEDLSSRIRDIPLEAERVQAGLQHVLETQT